MDTVPEIREILVVLSHRYAFRELAYLIGAGVLTGVGFASVYIARRSEISSASLTYAAFFFALYLVAHFVARYTVPYADPYLLPIAALLTDLKQRGVIKLSGTRIVRIVDRDALEEGERRAHAA